MKIEQVAALVSSHCLRDEDRFQSVCAQIIAGATRAGNTGVASRIKAALRDGARYFKPIALPNSAGNLVIQVDPQASLADLVLAPVADTRVRTFIQQFRETERLSVHNLTPMSRMLFEGPPGVGKTMTAEAIARELDLPLFVVDLTCVVESYLGATSANIGKIFEAIDTIDGVYLLDELDSLGANRASDGGGANGREMARVSVAMMQRLDMHPQGSRSVIIGATNHPELIDRALYRRLGERVCFPFPDAGEIGLLITRACARHKLTFHGDRDLIEAGRLQNLAGRVSHDQVDRAIEHLGRGLVLDGKTELALHAVVTALEQTKSTRPRIRR